MDYILIPIHQHLHWTLIIVNVQDRLIIYHDSCLNDGTVEMSLVLSYLCQEHLARTGRELKEGEWQLKHAKDFTPQDNSYDCGVYVCKFSRNLLKRDWDTLKMPAIRRHMIEELTQKDLIFA